MPDLFDIIDIIPDLRNRDQLIELAQLHTVDVEKVLQAAADLNRLADYEAIAGAFGKHRDVGRLRAELVPLASPLQNQMHDQPWQAADDRV